MAEGYEIPLHRSLTEPILMAGAPRTAAIAIGHSAAVFMARSDPDFMAVASRSTRHKEHLTC